MGSFSTHEVSTEKRHPLHPTTARFTRLTPATEDTWGQKTGKVSWQPSESYSSSSQIPGSLIKILCPLLWDAYLVWETGSSRLWDSKAESQWKGPSVDDTVQAQHFRVLKSSFSLQFPSEMRATLKGLQTATERGLLHSSELDEDGWGPKQNRQNSKAKQNK